MYECLVQVIGIDEPSPTMMDEDWEREQDDSKFIFEDMWEEAPESKIQSVPWLLSVKLFMEAMKAACSHVGGEGEADDSWATGGGVM